MEIAPALFHLPVAIAVGMVDSEGILTDVRSLDTGLMFDHPEMLVEDCWKLINHTPILITFNGRTFDLPVLEACALRYGISAPKYWGEQYGARYRYSKVHLDLLDILSNYGTATKGLTLSNVVQLLGYAGKDGMDGSMVQAFWEAGRLDDIRRYNRTDVIRTYGVWLHWARSAGRLTPALYQAAVAGSKRWLDQIR